MFSKYKVNKKHIIITIIGLIVLLYLFKPKTNFDSCYEKCMNVLWDLDKAKKPIICVDVCSRSK